MQLPEVHGLLKIGIQIIKNRNEDLIMNYLCEFPRKLNTQIGQQIGVRLKRSGYCCSSFSHIVTVIYGQVRFL